MARGREKGGGWPGYTTGTGTGCRRPPAVPLPLQWQQWRHTIRRDQPRTGPNWGGRDVKHAAWSTFQLTRTSYDRAKGRDSISGDGAVLQTLSWFKPTCIVFLFELHKFTCNTAMGYCIALCKDASFSLPSAYVSWSVRLLN